MACNMLRDRERSCEVAGSLSSKYGGEKASRLGGGWGAVGAEWKDAHLNPRCLPKSALGRSHPCLYKLPLLLVSTLLFPDKSNGEVSHWTVNDFND